MSPDLKTFLPVLKALQEAQGRYFHSAREASYRTIIDGTQYLFNMKFTSRPIPGFMFECLNETVNSSRNIPIVEFFYAEECMESDSFDIGTSITYNEYPFTDCNRFHIQSTSDQEPTYVCYVSGKEMYEFDDLTEELHFQDSTLYKIAEYQKYVYIQEFSTEIMKHFQDRDCTDVIMKMTMDEKLVTDAIINKCCKAIPYLLDLVDL